VRCDWPQPRRTECSLTTHDRPVRRGCGRLSQRTRFGRNVVSLDEVIWDEMSVVNAPRAGNTRYDRATSYNAQSPLHRVWYSKSTTSRNDGVWVSRDPQVKVTSRQLCKLAGLLRWQYSVTRRERVSFEHVWFVLCSDAGAVLKGPMGCMLPQVALSSHCPLPKCKFSLSVVWHLWW